MAKIIWFLTVAASFSFISSASFGRLTSLEEEDLAELSTDHNITSLTEEITALAQPTEGECTLVIIMYCKWLGQTLPVLNRQRRRIRDRHGKGKKKNRKRKKEKREKKRNRERKVSNSISYSISNQPYDRKEEKRIENAKIEKSERIRG